MLVRESLRHDNIRKPARENDGMTCNELSRCYTPYALGTAGDPERIEIGEHLARACPNCVQGVARAMASAAPRSSAVEAAPPEERSVKAAAARLRVGSLVPWAIAAVLSVGLLAVGILGRRQTADTGKLQRALTILADPSTVDAAFGQKRKTARGRVFVNPARGLVLIAAELPRLDAGKTFELWVIPAKGDPAPQGVFESRADATAVFVRLAPIDNAVAVTVTVEPDGGSPQPTTARIIDARL